MTPQPITIARGVVIDYQLSLFGAPFSWRTEISVWEPPNRFVDTQRRGPYREWIHTHTFRSTAGGTLSGTNIITGIMLALSRICGEAAPLHFCRDSEGNEVDLLIPEGGRQHAIEIKAGATVSPDYLKGLRAFAAHHPAHIAGGSVIYAGEASQPRSDWPVHSWQSLLAKPDTPGG